MDYQYLRECSLVVSDDTGDTADLSNLRVVFRITHGIQSTPRLLSARIYNPSAQTIDRVKKLYTKITLSVGYTGKTSVLFQGKIWQTRDGRENPVDTFLDIFATTGEQAFTFSTISTTLPAGWQYSDMHNAAAQAMAVDNIVAGAFPQIDGSAPRPKVVYGMTRDHARVLGHSTGSVWGIDGQEYYYRRIADMAKIDSKRPVIELTPETGLVGIPVQTPDGVQVTCLINPDITVNTFVRISGVTVLDAVADASISPSNVANIQGGYDGTKASVVGESPSSTYSVVWVEHYGDTRGNDWYSTLNCYAADVSADQAAVATGGTIGAGY